MSAVLLQGVHRWFGSYHALRGVDLEVAKGERIILCGPSGSGKSTLIRCINGLEPHDEGIIRIGTDVVTPDPRALQRIRMRVGMVFQQFNLFPHLSVLENCMLAPVRVLKMRPAEAEDLAHRLLARVRIGDQALKHPGELSGGQQQRAAIARALCMSPEVMLFDEPTSALDAEMVKEVLDILIQLAADGMTMICVTHELGFAREVADRIAFVDEGRIVEIDEPARFFDAPRHERTRNFLAQLIR
ncbi:amino acid ABC transporter ATP-binding protein [Sphingomonadaceae bacterium OTU29THOMA1]|nr:amino acid ABC transporter ATP-binding protein [Sphingomonadaceae bacterium OTU29THOMA1]